MSDRLLRLSVGLEDVEDLWRDLREALGTATDANAGAGAAEPVSAATIPSPVRGTASV